MVIEPSYLSVYIILLSNSSSGSTKGREVSRQISQAQASEDLFVKVFLPIRGLTSFVTSILAEASISSNSVIGIDAIKL